MAMGALSHDTELKTLSRDDANILIGWPLESWRKPQLTLSVEGMPELPWYLVKKHERAQNSVYVRVNMLSKGRKLTK